MFLQEEVVSLSANPNVEDQVSVLVVPGDGAAQLYPRALRSWRPLDCHCTHDIVSP
jgi:hypothetical protein